MARRRTNGRLWNMTEAHKMERLGLERRIDDLQNKLEDKPEAKLKDKISGDVEGIVSMGEKVDSMKECLKEKEDKNEVLPALNQTLIIKEREANDELQEARKGLIIGLEALLVRNFPIGVKVMGHLDEHPFHIAATRMYPFEEVEQQEIIDEEDENIKVQKINCNDEIYKALRTVLTEIDEEFNPSERYPVPEL